MKKTYCDICGKEAKSSMQMLDAFDKFFFSDMHDDPIEDVCEECYKMIYCCINMMKETKWRPDFHEVLESDSIHTRDMAGYRLSELEDKTGLSF